MLAGLVVVGLTSVLLLLMRLLIGLLKLLLRRDQKRSTGLEPPDLILRRPHVHQQHVHMIAMASAVGIGVGSASSSRGTAAMFPMMSSTSSGSTCSGMLAPALAEVAGHAVATVGPAHVDGTPAGARVARWCLLALPANRQAHMSRHARLPWCRRRLVAIM